MLSEKKIILLIHPSGNFHSNPSLYSILKLLVRNNFIIDYLCLDSHGLFYQESTFSNLNVIKLDRRGKSKDYIKLIAQVLNKNYDMVIGTHEGIVPASVFSKNFSIPLILLSYEMTFEDEVGYLKQSIEKDACSNVILAVSQDPVRSYFLSRECNIPRSKIINIPIASTFDHLSIDKAECRKRLNIDITKKVVLLAGTISERNMVTKLMNIAKQWSDDWILVIHTFVPLSKKTKEKLLNSSKKIVFSDEPLPSIEDLGTLFSIADIGIALTSPVYNTEYAQKNVIFMGLSSGKISTYLKYGIPVIINEIGQMSDYVRTFNLGSVVRRIEDIDTTLLNNLYHSKLHGNCISFFKSHLDFDLYGVELMNLVQRIINKQTINIDLIKSINARTNIEISESNIHQIALYYNKEIEIRQSKYYRLGHVLINPIKSSKFGILWLYRTLKLKVKKIIYPKQNDPNEFISNIIKLM